MAPPNPVPPPPTDLADRYRVLLEIGRTLTGTLSLDDLFRAIYRETSRVVEAEGFYISLYDEAEDLATVVFFADQDQEQHVEVTYPGSSSEVIRTGEPTLVTDSLNLQSLSMLGDRDSKVSRSSMAAPLLYQGRILGAISTQSYDAGSYGEDDLELLQGIADIAAVAIENARHVRELRQRRLEAEQLEEIGRTLTRTLDPDKVFQTIVEAVAETVRTDGATVWLLKEGENQVVVGASVGDCTMAPGTRMRVSSALSDLPAQEWRSVIINDVRSSTMIPEEFRQQLSCRSGILVPLVVGDRLLGALSAEQQSPRTFVAEDANLLRRLAGQAAVALENARLHEDLQSMSLTDALTGLPNRRHLQMHLDREVAAARRGRALVLVIYDLDGFKVYNDTLGHIEGDRALAVVGDILKAETRAMNLGARYGGDEFVSVLSDSDMKGAMYHAHRVQEKVAEHATFAQYGLTLSYGIAMFDPESMRTPDDLIRAADSKLYSRKRDSGNGGRRASVGAAGTQPREAQAE